MGAETRLREDALACFAAAVQAVDPERLVRETLKLKNDLLPEKGNVYLISIGKASRAMAQGADTAWGHKMSPIRTVIFPWAPTAEPPPVVSMEKQIFFGGHPLPNEEGKDGAWKILRESKGLSSDDLLLCLLSGGGSALMTLPPDGISLEDVQKTTALLLKAGADIGQLNAVRKHLDQLKGGRLAQAAAPARVLALILSDVIGDPLDVIASGPVSPDPTTYDDAKSTMKDLQLWNKAPASVRDHLDRGAAGDIPESPNESDPCFENVVPIIIGNNVMAAEAACEEARARGYDSLILATDITGEARTVGEVFAEKTRAVRESGDPVFPPACLVQAGETTVTVTGSGSGGRNQEVALGAAAGIAGLKGVLMGSMGTDGIDGPTDAAGALVTGDTMERAQEHGLDPARALTENDTYPFFKGMGDLIMTGPTGTNVMDIHLAFISKAGVEE